MKQKNLFFPLLMAIVMMAMSPMKMWADDVASVTINGTTTNFETVEDAFAAANVNGQTSTIKLLTNYTYTTGTRYFIQATAGNITLDLNGKTLAMTSSESVIQVAGANLTIKDSGIGGIVSGNYYALEFVSGKLVINGGIFNGSNFSLFAYYAQNYSAGDIVIKRGKFIKRGTFSIEVPYGSSGAGWDLIDFRGKIVDENGNDVSIDSNDPYLRVTVEVVNDPSSVEIGDDDNIDYTGMDFPYGNCYRYSTSITLYKLSELGRSGMITEIAYNVAKKASNGLTTNELKIYMMMTDKTDLSNCNDLDASGFTLVYSGNPTLGTTEGWENLKFDTPFNYNDNTKNLLIAVCRKSDDYNSGICYYTSQSANDMTIYARVGDDSEYGELNNLSSRSFVYSNSFANIQIRLLDINQTRTIEDGTAYSTPAYVNELTYRRTFSNTNWQALYVPFQMSYSDWSADFDVATIQNFHEYTDENGVVQNTVLEVRYVKSGKLKANHPYLIRPKTAGEKTITLSNVALANSKSNSIVCQSVERKYTFTGTYNSMQDLYTNDYLFMTGGSLMKAMDDDTTLKAQRWYLAIENLDAQVESGSSPAGAKAINISVIGEDDATGIEEIKVISTSVSGTSATAAGIYDLQGRRQQSLGKGVNIIRQTDGTVKKVMVK